MEAFTVCDPGIPSEPVDHTAQLWFRHALRQPGHLDLGIPSWPCILGFFRGVGGGGGVSRRYLGSLRGSFGSLREYWGVLANLGLHTPLELSLKNPRIAGCVRPRKTWPLPWNGVKSSAGT